MPGYFLQHRAYDECLWNYVGQRVGDNSTLRDFIVVITDLAAKLFAAPLPIGSGVSYRGAPRRSSLDDRYARAFSGNFCLRVPHTPKG